MEVGYYILRHSPSSLPKTSLEFATARLPNLKDVKIYIYFEDRERIKSFPKRILEDFFERLFT